jgi:dynein assembly factor 2
MKKREEEIKECERKQAKTGNQEPTPPRDDIYSAPKYTIKHRSNFDLQDFREARDAKTDLIPDSIVIEVHLPLLKSAAPIDLDIFERNLKLQSESPAKYKLDLALPYQVDENEGSASFDKSKRTLTVTLPVIKPKSSPVHQIPEKTVDDSGPMVELTKLQDQTRPLNEVLGSQDSGVDVSESREDLSKATEPNVDVNHVIAEPKAVLPTYDISQTDETVSFVIDVKNIVRQSIQKNFLTKAPFNGADLKFCSMGSGGFPMHYQMSIRLPEAYMVDLDCCDLRVSNENAVLVFAKADNSLGDWESIFVGLNPHELEVSVLSSYSIDVHL